MKSKSNQRLLWLATGATAALSFQGCGSSSSVVSGLDSLSQLPALTGAVSSEGSSSRVRTSLLPTELGSSLRATTGGKLGDLPSASWSGKSPALCHNARMTGQVLGDAASPDRVRCYIGVMQKHGAFTDLGDSNRYVKYVLTQNNGSGQVKFRVSRDEDGKFNGFRMFSCMGESAGQEGYMDIAINDGVARITSVFSHSGTHSGATSSGAGRVVVEGNINSSGGWTSKTITALNKFQFSQSSNTNSHSQKTILTQTADGMTLRGYMSSSGTWASSSYTHAGAFSSVFEILNASSLSTFAIGDGSTKASFTSTGGSQSGVNSWNGDTRAEVTPASNGTYYGAADALSLLDSSAIATITADTAFSADESWDCSASDAVATVNFQSLMTSNAAFAADFQACENFRDPMEGSTLSCN